MQERMELFKEYEYCKLCPRQCGANRQAGEKGICGAGARLRAASLTPHFGEEPSFTGQKGSGTIFLSGCSCQCVFCQNHQISQSYAGRDYTADAFYDATYALTSKGVHNLNFVTPDHFWPHIRHICKRLRAEGDHIPIIFNTSGYQGAAMVDQYSDWVDIFLPDFKFAAPDLARQCMADPAYPEIALEGLRKMVEKKGFLHPWDPSGRHTATTGVLVRHLAMPGRIDNTLAVLEILREEFGRFLPLSVMSQYQPMPGSMDIGEMDRQLTESEYSEVCGKIETLGFENVYIQELSSQSEFIPDFKKEQPFFGNR